MNPLDRLAAPILPPPPDFWPPAPGWWLLAALLLAALALLWQQRRRLQAWWQRRYPAAAPVVTLDPQRQAALDELQRLPRPYDGAPAGPWLQALNALLKRLCRAHYPDSHSHTLSGRAWLAFLDNRCPAAGLTRWMILVEGTYRADCRLDDKAISGLQQSVETWIRKHA
ncbi:DUF4381 domain-containing protein [Pseudomonas sp. MAP12]|uniref:DUF4381 domain-containing protein n=1 Tax=Geopseudomonas aromaticivorans TaxID=2849492 RepID=A0ABS6N0K8_9GAMM|nr:DUF4381 domain-containing protein [Pseudomonas aromaticivorans]MBV2134586.1 DUF4381 domain-containing protein [Pseudomonas aromaticivorans]